MARRGWLRKNWYWVAAAALAFLWWKGQQARRAHEAAGGRASSQGQLSQQTLEKIAAQRSNPMIQAAAGNVQAQSTDPAMFVELGANQAAYNKIMAGATFQ